ncbi:MAG: TlpA family protein disulfide reductase [Candidatus Nezhaarchaeota archaeon]|nr:TlpA family protein disulfide reductase [Candidatus Nezhaarchaeota archaeon]
MLRRRMGVRVRRKAALSLSVAIVIIASAYAWLQLHPLLSGWLLGGGSVATGMLAPDFSLVDLDGNPFSLSGFRGRVVVLDFMATWCGPCRAQIPYLNEVKEKYGGSVVIVSISIDSLHDSEEVLRRFLKEHPYATWVWARDTAGVGRTYGVAAIPTLFIIDREGYVRFRHVGLTPQFILVREVEEVLRGG